VSAVLGGLDAPEWAWIVVAGLALLAFARAYALHVKEGVDHPVPADSSASPTADGRVYGNAAIRQAISEELQPGGEMRSMQLMREGLVEQPAQEKRDLVEAEFVAMIDKGEFLRGDEFSGNPQWGDFTAWRDPIAEFVGTVLGTTEKQRLLEAGVRQPEVRGVGRHSL